MSSAWIFLSIGDAGGCRDWVDLDGLIGSADSMNHAIPTIDELEAGVSNLEQAGFVEASGTRTRLTSAGCDVFDSVNKANVGHIQRFVDLDRRWKRRGFPPVAARTWSVDPDAYRAAFETYDQWFWNTAQKLGISRPRRPT